MNEEENEAVEVQDIAMNQAATIPEKPKTQTKMTSFFVKK